MGRSVGVVGLEEKSCGWDFCRAIACWAEGERSRREIRERSSFRRRAVAEVGGESGSFSCKEEGRVVWPWRRWSIRRMRSSSRARVSAAVFWDMFSSTFVSDRFDCGSIKCPLKTVYNYESTY